jgi:hypothetical protein
MSTLPANLRRVKRLAPIALTAAVAALAACAPVAPGGFPTGLIATDGAPDGYGVLLNAVQVGFGLPGAVRGGVYGGQAARPDAARDRASAAEGYARPGAVTPLHATDARMVSPAAARQTPAVTAPRPAVRASVPVKEK